MVTGIILPNSNYYPYIGKDFQKGYVHYMQQQGIINEVKIRKAGFGIPNDVVKAANELILDEEVDLLLVFADSWVGQDLTQIVKRTKIPCIISDLGAKIPKIEELNEYIFLHSLNLWQSNWIAGSWGTQNLGRHALMATSFYDSAYGFNVGFSLGIEAMGGNIDFVVVTHKDNDEVELENAIQAIQREKPDYVYAIYSRADAVSFFEKLYNNSQNLPPVMAHPLALDSSVLEEITCALPEINTISPWSQVLDNEVNKTFISSFREGHGVTPSIFAMLGYEAASIIEASLKKENDIFNKTSFLANINDTTITTPRGEIRIGEKGYIEKSPQYLFSVSKDSNGKVHENQIETLGQPESYLPILENYSNMLQVGWHNSYLCV